ncbi:MAG: protein kinase [Kofleriaceae bacterium]|nr:protein kinase [Kofleriaceae bacterium]
MGPGTTTISPASDPLLHTTLGKYKVLEQIGIGGMGTVYLVEHQGLKKRFAAKVLSKELASSREAQARFSAEAQSASQLEHENVVSVTDYGFTDDGRPYIVMEFLRGETLDVRMLRGRLTLEEIVAVIIPTCHGLAAAHAASIVHRDIKPENIFLVHRPNDVFAVKVLDFGIAKTQAVNDKLTKMGQTLGSPMYMAPEACRGEEVDARADVYSVGVLLYQLMCGRLPFEDENLLKVLHMQTQDPVPLPRVWRPDIDPLLEAVIMRALAKEAQDRYYSIDSMVADFESVLPEGADTLLLRAQPGQARRTQSIPTLSAETARLSQRITPIPLGSGSLPAVGHMSAPTIGGAAPAMLAPMDTNVRSSSRVGLIAAVAVLLLGGGVAAFALMGGDKDAATTPAALPGTAGSGTTGAGPKVDSTDPGTKPPGTEPGGETGAAAGDKDGSGGKRVVGPPTEVVPVPTTPTSVKLVVRSSPKGATVRIGDTVLGKTPLTVDRPYATDNITLEVVKDGFVTETRALTFERDRDIELALDRVVVERRRPGGGSKTGGSSGGTTTVKPPPPDPGPTSGSGNDDGGLKIRGNR